MQGHPSGIPFKAHNQRPAFRNVLLEVDPLAMEGKHSVPAQPKILFDVAREYAAGLLGVELAVDLVNIGRGSQLPVGHHHPYGSGAAAVFILVNEGDVDPKRLCKCQQQGQPVHGLNLQRRL